MCTRITPLDDAADAAAAAHSFLLGLDADELETAELPRQVNTIIYIESSSLPTWPGHSLFLLLIISRNQ